MSKVFDGRFGIRTSVKKTGEEVLIIAAKADGEFTAADAQAAYEKICKLSKTLKLPVSGVFEPNPELKVKRSPVILHRGGKPYFAMFPEQDAKRSRKTETKWL